MSVLIRASKLKPGDCIRELKDGSSIWHTISRIETSPAGYVVLYAPSTVLVRMPQELVTADVVPDA